MIHFACSSGRRGWGRAGDEVKYDRIWELGTGALYDKSLVLSKYCCTMFYEFWTGLSNDEVEIMYRNAHYYGFIHN